MREIDALARTVFGEARGEPVEGQIAVAHVVRNRQADSRYPASVAGVVKQPWQFSTWNENDHNRAVIERADEDTPGFLLAVEVAARVLRGDVADPTHGATHYHADWIAPPRWADPSKVTARIGRHVFYRGIA